MLVIDHYAITSCWSEIMANKWGIMKPLRMIQNCIESVGTTFFYLYVNVYGSETSVHRNAIQLYQQCGSQRGA